MRSRSIHFFAASALALGLYGCSGDSTAGDWVEADRGQIVISPYLDQTAEGKYLNVIYENSSQDTIRKLKYQLLATTGGKTDTIEKDIILKERLKPKDKHLVERATTEKPVNYDQVAAGKVWIVKE